MEWQLNNKEFTYILRYYLPCLPQYELDITERRIDELVIFCKKHSVGAVMFYVDLNPHWYYMPDTEEHNEYVVGIVKEAAQRLRDEGISYQLNYQNLFGAWDGNYDHRSMLPWEYYVDEHGNESYGCGCMIGERFRRISGKKLKLWAETKPDVVWIDDDMRIHNHRTMIHDFWDGKTPYETMDFGCFCEKHIKGFNEKTENNFTRKQIVEKCLTDGEVRKQWMIFQNDCLCDTAKWIKEIVHSTSPETRIAIMTSVPDVHAVEGRNWNEFLSGLSGGKIPLLRPTFGPYCERSPKDFAISYSLLESLKCNINAQYTHQVDYCPEVENTRFTRYSKSIAATKYQIGLSAFLGCRGVTLSIFDLEGCILEEEPEFGKMLDENKPFCDAMNSKKMHEYEDLGIAFVISPDRTQTARLGDKISGFTSMIAARNLDMLFAKAGIPIKYTNPYNISEARAIALDRFAVKLLNDDEIKKALSGATFLDGGAADELIKRGFAEYIGVKSMVKNKSVVSSEWLQKEKRSDGAEVFVPSRISGNKWFEVETDGCEVLSAFITPGGEKYPGFVSFENAFGGRVVMYAAEDDFGDGFYSNYRIDFLRKICNYLYSDIVTVKFPSYGVSAVRTNGEKTAVFVANLSSDECLNLKISTTVAAGNSEVILSSGKKYSVEIKNGIITLPNSLPIYDYAVIMF